MLREELHEIACRAAPLWARVDHVPADGHHDRAVAGENLARWRQVAADRDDERFNRYLSWLRLTPDAARRLVTPPDWRRMPARLDPWIDTIDRVAAIAKDVSPPVVDRAIDRRLPQPFEEALVPLVRVARADLAGKIGGRNAAFLPSAHARLERGLLRRLAHIADRALFVEFAAFRAGLAASPAGRASGGAGRGAYDVFVRECVLQDGYRLIFRRYPVLARQLATTVSSWVETAAELVARVDRDRRALEDLFGAGAPLGAVAAVTPDLSDSHRGGRTVCRLEFESGHRVIYKPRAMGREAAYHQLLDWLQARSGCALHAPRVLDLGSYGYAEAVAPAACSTPGEVRLFYRRAGMLLCLTYVIGSADLHSGNVIAAGAHPALVDLEALCGSPPARPDQPNEHEPTDQSLWDCVLRTGLLPAIHSGRHGRVYRGGGLIPIAHGTVRRRWIAVNTDAMALAGDQPSAAIESSHLPTLRGIPVAAAAHVREIADGFRQMADVLRAHAGEFRDVDGPLDSLAAQPSRVILRSTSTYVSLLDRITHPSHLSDGARQSIELECLKRAETQVAARPATWNALLDETAALERLDIPIFEAEPDGCALGTVFGPVADYLSESGRAAVHRRLAALSDRQVLTQTHIARVALSASWPSRASTVRSGAEGDHGREDGVAIALGWVDVLVAAAARADNELQWIGPARRAGERAFALQPIGWDLFGGRLGLSLAIAAAARVRAVGDRRVAHEIVRPLAERLNHGDWSSLPQQGGLGGRGGVAYGLWRVAELLESEPLRDAARAAARAHRLTATDDRRADVAAGRAGDILALVALQDGSSHSDLLERAVHCGRQIVSDASTAALPPGFAHGRAGVAYALARLHRATGDEVWRRHALALLPATEEPADSSWCRGASGIGLALLGSADLLDARELLPRAEQIAQRVVERPEPVGTPDHICCGRLGAIELLRAAGRRLQRPEWIATADRRLQHMVTRAVARGGFALRARENLFAPGFFQGLAGVVYQLLRGALPALPNVLLLE